MRGNELLDKMALIDPAASPEVFWYPAGIDSLSVLSETV